TCIPATGDGRRREHGRRRAGRCMDCRHDTARDDDNKRTGWRVHLRVCHVHLLRRRGRLDVPVRPRWRLIRGVRLARLLQRPGRRPHSFEVRATDPAGNTDLTPAHRTWNIDTSAVDATPPTATLIAPA